MGKMSWLNPLAERMQCGENRSKYSDVLSIHGNIVTSRLARQLVANKNFPLRLILSFRDAEYERRFARHYTDFHYRHAQARLALGFPLIRGHFLADLFAFAKWKGKLQRPVVCLPLLAAGMAYSFLNHARRHWQSAKARGLTARTHVIRIFNTLGLRSRTEAAMLPLRKGI